MARNARHTSPTQGEHYGGNQHGTYAEEARRTSWRRKERLRTSVWFKPEEGDTDIRIVPAADGDPLKRSLLPLQHRRSPRWCDVSEAQLLVRTAQSVILPHSYGDGTETNDEETKKLAKSLLLHSVTSHLLLFAAWKRRRKGLRLRQAGLRTSSRIHS